MSTNAQEKLRRADQRAAKVRSRVITTVGTYCVLSLAGAVSFVLPEAVPVGATADIPRPVYGPQPSAVLPDTIAGAIARSEVTPPPGDAPPEAADPAAAGTRR